MSKLTPEIAAQFARDLVAYAKPHRGYTARSLSTVPAASFHCQSLELVQAWLDAAATVNGGLVVRQRLSGTWCFVLSPSVVAYQQRTRTANGSKRNSGRRSSRKKKFVPEVPLRHSALPEVSKYWRNMLPEERIAGLYHDAKGCNFLLAHPPSPAGFLSVVAVRNFLRWNEGVFYAIVGKRMHYVVEWTALAHVVCPGQSDTFTALAPAERLKVLYRKTGGGVFYRQDIEGYFREKPASIRQWLLRLVRNGYLAKCEEHVAGKGDGQYTNKGVLYDWTPKAHAELEYLLKGGK